jgi:murein DD-endopeptidase MepM/ murein hydrolase activator NlpD
LAFLASALFVSFSFVAAIMPALDLGGPRTAQPQFPAPPGYVLPWAGGEIHSVSQGEETSLTHNGMAAYAFDFDLAYETVLAARGGKVVLVRQDSNSGGCNAIFASAANYVVIDHGDGTSGLYLHLKQHSALVKPGDVVVQGQPIATSGQTGLTCSDNETGPGPHLHFQVERTDNSRYFTQALPIAFDDIPMNDGVPNDGRAYVSGNYGPGKPQRIKLVPHHQVRVFHPVAIPLHPELYEAPQVIEPAAANGMQANSVAPTDTPTPTEEPFFDFEIEFPTPSDGTPKPTRTPVPTDTPEPPPPPDTATPAPAPTQTSITTATPVPPTSTPAATDTPTAKPSPPATTTP